MNRPRHGLTGALRAVLPLLALAPMLPHAAGADQITVDWTDPEIQKFAQQAAGNPPLAPDLATKIASLKLPVLAFASVPQLIQNAEPAGQTPLAPTRQVIMNEADPTWYQLNDQYGDITISVLASLTVNREVAKSTIYQAPTPPGTNAPGDPAISVFDENGEPGFAGLIIEYTVYKFPNIPYTVTIECPQALKDKCNDLTVVAQDRNRLTVIGATPPK
jgi:hypothetical protein